MLRSFSFSFMSMFLSLPLILVAGPALAIHKCEVNGKISYSDTPCAAGKASEIAIKQTVTPEDTARALERVEKDRQQLDLREQAQRRQDAIDQKQAASKARISAADQRRCKELALKLGWLTEDAARAPPAGVEKAKLAQRRASDQFALECS